MIAEATITIKFTTGYAGHKDKETQPLSYLREMLFSELKKARIASEKDDGTCLFTAELIGAELEVIRV